MSTPLRLAAFGAGLALVFVAALGVGRLVGPFDEPEPTGHAADGGHGSDRADGAAGADEEGGRVSITPMVEEEVLGGLQVAEQGYTFDLHTPGAAAGDDVPVEFAIHGPDGGPVTDFDVLHEKQLHLIAVRRDNTGFQHVHPTMADGVWTTTLDLTGGSWRLFADFVPTGGPALTLGADLQVDGDFAAAPEPAESRPSTVDGYQVTLEGDLMPGADSALTLTVSRGGEPVTDLEPYLGAYGHLVALRDGDLAYLHVHPDGEPGDGETQSGPAVVFHTAVPSVGTYHLHLDFQHGGVVRTAHFTVATTGHDAGGSDQQDDHQQDDHQQDDHQEGDGSEHAH